MIPHIASLICCSRTPLLRVMLLSLVVAAALNSEALAQKGAKPRGSMKPVPGQKGGGRARKETQLSEMLPPAFQGLDNSDVQCLTEIARQAQRWLLHDSPPDPVFQHIPDFTSASAAGITPDAVQPDPQTEVRCGLFILSCMDLEHRRRLASILDENRRDLQQLQKSGGELTDLLAGLRKESNLNPRRPIEVAGQGSVQEVGRVEAAVTVRQARIFAALEDSLSADQKESIVLAWRSGTVPESGLSAMNSVEAELRGAEPEVRSELKRLAWHAGAWLTQESLYQAPLQPHAENGDKSVTRQEREPEEVLTGLLELLTVPQQEALRQLVVSEGQADLRIRNLTNTVNTGLNVLRTGRVLDERKLRQLTTERAQLIFANAAARIRTFETIRRSMSETQQIHFRESLSAK